MDRGEKINVAFYCERLFLPRRQENAGFPNDVIFDNQLLLVYLQSKLFYLKVIRRFFTTFHILNVGDRTRDSRLLQGNRAQPTQNLYKKDFPIRGLD